MKKYRDTFFRFYFNDKARLLSLCNALTGEDATDPNEIEINTARRNFFQQAQKRYFLHISRTTADFNRTSNDLERKYAAAIFAVLRKLAEQTLRQRIFAADLQPEGDRVAASRILRFLQRA